MTRKEAIKWLIRPVATSTEIGEVKQKEFEAYNMAIEALKADGVQGEWIDIEIHCNPYPPLFCVECSRCGYRVDRETFLENTFSYCPSCGARMKGGDIK